MLTLCAKPIFTFYGHKLWWCRCYCSSLSWYWTCVWRSSMYALNVVDSERIIWNKYNTIQYNLSKCTSSVEYTMHDEYWHSKPFVCDVVSIFHRNNINNNQMCFSVGKLVFQSPHDHFFLSLLNYYVFVYWIWDRILKGFSQIESFI